MYTFKDSMWRRIWKILQIFLELNKARWKTKQGLSCWSCLLLTAVFCAVSFGRTHSGSTYRPPSWTFLPRVRYPLSSSAIKPSRLVDLQYQQPRLIPIISRHVDVSPRQSGGLYCKPERIICFWPAWRRSGFPKMPKTLPVCLLDSYRSRLSPWSSPRDDVAAACRDAFLIVPVASRVSEQPSTLAGPDRKRIKLTRCYRKRRGGTAAAGVVPDRHMHACRAV